MGGQALVVPYDVSMQYVQGKMRRIYHDFHDWGNEMVLVLEGTGRYYLNEFSFEIGRGDIFVLRGDYSKEIRDADRLRFCSIYFREEDMQRMAGTFRRLEGYQTLFIQNPMTGSYQAQDRLHADEDLMEDLQWLLDRMVQEQKLMEPGFEQILNSSFFILITLISRAFSEKITFTQRREADFAHTVAYMQTHYAQPLRIPQLAQMAHLSERQFNRRFKSIYHVSPSQFLVQLRMNRACILLEESGLNISEIAMECGFSDINYFSSSFRAMFGKSASQYRMERETEVKTSDLKRHRPKKES